MFQRVVHLSTVFICRYSKLLLNYNNLFAHTCKMAEKNHWDIWTKLASQNRMCKKTLSKWTYCLFTSSQEPCVLSISLAWQVKWNASFLVSVIYFLQFPLKYFVLRLQDHFFYKHASSWSHRICQQVTWLDLCYEGYCDKIILDDLFPFIFILDDSSQTKFSTLSLRDLFEWF